MSYDDTAQTIVEGEKGCTFGVAGATDQARLELLEPEPKEAGEGSTACQKSSRKNDISEGREPQKVAEGSTAPREPTVELRKQIMSLCNAAKYEHFEDGMESPFSQELVQLIRKHREQGAEALAGLIVYRVIDDDVASEALRWIGLMQDSSSYLYRRWLLTNCLFCRSAKVRDGAALGLAFLNDPYPIPYLKKSIEQEQRPWLIRRMQQVLSQLEAVH